MRFLTCFALMFLTCASAFAQPLPDEAEGMSCEQPVLWMAKYGLEGFGKPYCVGCLPGRGETCAAAVEEKGKSVLVAGPLERVEETHAYVSLAACDIAAHQHQLLRAWHGRPVEKAWKGILKKHFGWVGERPRVSYPKAAVPMLKALASTRSECTKLEKKYAKVLRSAEKFAHTGKTAKPIASELDGWGGPGLTKQVLYRDAMKRKRRSLTLYSEPQTLGHMFNEDQPLDEPHPNDPDFRVGLTPKWRAKKYVAVVSYGDGAGGFRCWEECEGGYSLDLYVDDKGELVGQMASMSACPFVYTAPAGSEAFLQQGEILRNLRRPELETEQTLRISGEAEACEEGLLRVRLTEEKRELTYLDDVALRVGDTVVKPVSCGEAAYCSNDGRYAEIAEGEKLEFVFAIPDDARTACEDIELWADGYYIPLD